jgi:hypothetical protein
MPHINVKLILQKTKTPQRELRGFCVFGGAKRDRTADLYNAIVALSQLSYSPKTTNVQVVRWRAFYAADPWVSSKSFAIESLFLIENQ